MSSRSEARRRVMQALYAHALSGDAAEHLIATLLKPELRDDPQTFRFAKQLLLRTLSRTEEIDEAIGRHAENWAMARISPIDKTLLRMATCELLAFEDIPPKVSIDEALEIAKSYSTEKSSAFINGLLDSVLMDLQKQGRMKKTGRGRVGLASIEERAAS